MKTVDVTDKIKLFYVDDGYAGLQECVCGYLPGHDGDDITIHEDWKEYGFNPCPKCGRKFKFRVVVEEVAEDEKDKHVDRQPIKSIRGPIVAEIKPCPRCGREPSLDETSLMYVCVMCPSASCGFCGGSFENDEGAAINDWNKLCDIYEAGKGVLGILVGATVGILKQKP